MTWHPFYLAGKGGRTKLETWGLSGPLSFPPSGLQEGCMPRGQTQGLATCISAPPAQATMVLGSDTCVTSSQGWESLMPSADYVPLPCPLSPPLPHVLPAVSHVSYAMSCVPFSLTSGPKGVGPCRPVASTPGPCSPSAPWLVCSLSRGSHGTATEAGGLCQVRGLQLAAAALIECRQYAPCLASALLFLVLFWELLGSGS